MDLKKPLNNLSIDDLFEQLSKAPAEDKKYNLKSPVNLFLSTFNIETGNHPIPTQLVYTLYKQWGKTRLDKYDFINKCSEILGDPKSNFFYINQESISISEKVYNIIKDKKINKRLSTFYKNHAEEFIIKNGIIESKKKISIDDLNQVYRATLDPKLKTAPLSKNELLNLIKLYFPHNDTEIFCEITKVESEKKAE